MVKTDWKWWPGGLVLLAVMAVGCNPPVSTETDTGVQEEDDEYFVQREFACHKQFGEAGERPIGMVKGADGAQIFVRPTDEDCQFTLHYRSADGSETQLDGPAPVGGFLMAEAVERQGQRILCATNIRHSADDTFGEAGRRMDDAPLECAAGQDDGFAPMERIVEPGGDWAAWLLQISSVEGKPSAFDVYYMRDNAFSLLHLTDEARPEEDGIYKVRVRLTDGRVEHDPPELYSDSLISADDINVKSWTPTEEQKKKYPDVVNR